MLSLWNYANPQQPNGKELCDVLAVFGAHIILFSVKDITLKPHADPHVAAERWTRRAIDASIDQLRGARRTLAKIDTVIRSDGSQGVRLAPAAERIIHSIAVAAGGNREVPFGGGIRDGEYVHVMDEFSLREILGELDTAPDLLHYLTTKESFKGAIVCEGEENFFARYLHAGRKLPDVDRIIAEDGHVGRAADDDLAAGLARLHQPVRGDDIGEIEDTRRPGAQGVPGRRLRWVRSCGLETSAGDFVTGCGNR